MKILNLRIISPNKKTIQDIKFNESGISIILADIKRKEDTKETINSLGKTLLLKMIDYLYGSDIDKTYFKEEINEYIIEGTIEQDNRIFNCKRVIGDSGKNIINNQKYTHEEYKSFFSINRSFLDKQVFLEEKKSLISPRQHPGLNDYLDVLTLLNFKNIDEDLKDIYETQDFIKNLKKNRESLMSLYNLNLLSDLEEEIFLIDKRTNEYQEKLNEVTHKVDNIQIVDMKEDVLEEFVRQNNDFKKTKRDIELVKIEKKRLENFIEESNNNNVTSKDVIAIYEQAKIEIPDMVKKEINKVQKFHEKVYLERKTYLEEQIVQLDQSYDKLEDELEEISSKVDYLGGIISENKAYKEAISYYEKFTKELNDLRFRQGQLFQLKEIKEKIDKNSNELTEKFEKAKLALDENKILIDRYRDFIYDFVNLIYTDDVSAYFGMKIRDRHLTRRPITVELNLRGDTGEGRGNVRKLLIDYLIFNFNERLDILIQDSSCYNGIDPRQVAGMLNELNKLAKVNNKQAIISLNKYQVDDNDDTDKFLKENSVIILSEDENLLNISF